MQNLIEAVISKFGQGRDCKKKKKIVSSGDEKLPEIQAAKARESSLKKKKMEVSNKVFCL